jgi:hypothetical protein
MQKGICERCGQYRWINRHHIYPREYFGNKGNDEIVTLCLDCHADIHEQLPKEKQDKEFYKTFTAKFIAGTLLLLLLYALL